MTSDSPIEFIIKKRTKRFKRFHSNRFKRVKPSWRRPRGIDNRVRRGFKSTLPMPNIGYGSAKATRHMLQNGLRKFIVHNPKDLESLLMEHKSFCAEVAHNVGARKRIEIVQRAKELNVVLINGQARLAVADSE